MYFRRVYYQKGDGKGMKFWGVSNPPTHGNSHAFVIPPEKHTGMITLFCPYSMQAFVIKENSLEVHRAPDIELTDKYRKSLIRIIMENWDAGGEGKSYSTAITVLKFLGAPVPELKQVDELAPEKRKSTGGKPVADKLIKLVKKNSKRGKIAEFFMQGQKTLFEAMSLFGVTRSGALTHLHNLNSTHGLGYVLNANNTVDILIPEKTKDIFE